MDVSELKGRLADLTEQAKNIRDAADAEKRDCTEQDATNLDAIFSDFRQTEAELGRRQTIADLEAKMAEPAPRKVAPQQIRNAATPAEQQSRDGLQNTTPRSAAQRGRWGWNTMGDFAKAVIGASRKGQQAIDQRLIVNAVPGTYGSEGVGTDGGFAVPPDFRQEIMTRIMAEESLLARADPIPTSGNQLVIPTDDTAPWDATGGIQAYWTEEGGLKAQSKPVLGQTTVRLHKLAVLVPMTDELMEDAPALETYLKKKSGDKIDFAVSLAIVQGTGVGKPLGILNSAGTVVVAKESGQAADTIVFQNILKMWSRLYAPNRPNAIWMVNQDTEAQLSQMVMPIKNVAGTENVGGVPVYMPAGGLSGLPFATLFGRPVVPSQALETLGDKGDIILGDMRQYLAAVKGGGVREDVSIHLWFDYDITAFRFVMRIGGQPWWNSAVTQRDGGSTLGSFVTLAERA